MDLISKNAKLNGAVRIPASKSHTIRALLIATLADGQSFLKDPLVSGDTLSCVEACKKLGAKIETSDDLWTVTGTNLNLSKPTEAIDVGNSGTTLYLAMSVAALSDHPITFTGDYQIQRRSASALIKSLRDLGCTIKCQNDNDCAPLTISGPMSGGSTSISCPTSQYLSSLLLGCPLSTGEAKIDVPLLNEKPYVEMTIDWMQRHGVEVINNDYKSFVVKGNQQYTPVNQPIPSDFSSATFFLVAAAITNSDVRLNGLDMQDSQGDKDVVEMLQRMGADIEIGPDFVHVKSADLTGAVLDLNATPDALPALAVAGCFAKGETRLVNVPQAREKETDRIAVMATELKKLGADIEELEDGLIIRQSALTGGKVAGHDDHRVVMSLAVAGLCASGDISIDSAEAMSITFPSFTDLMNKLGAEMLVK